MYRVWFKWPGVDAFASIVVRAPNSRRAGQVARGLAKSSYSRSLEYWATEQFSAIPERDTEEPV